MPTWQVQHRFGRPPANVALPPELDGITAAPYDPMRFETFIEGIHAPLRRSDPAPRPRHGRRPLGADPAPVAAARSGPAGRSGREAAPARRDRKGARVEDRGA